eukprot:1748-Pelagococcus_subviridis.AAC.4
MIRRSIESTSSRVLVLYDYRASAAALPGGSPLRPRLLLRRVAAASAAAGRGSLLPRVLLPFLLRTLPATAPPPSAAAAAGRVRAGSHPRRDVPLRAPPPPELHRVHLRRKLERAQRLLRARRLRVDVDKHQRLPVAAEARLQQIRQLAVPVRHVRLLVRQRLEHVPEARQRLVNRARLLEPRALGARSPDAFAPSQIHEVQAPGEPRPGRVVRTRDVQHEDGVRARGHRVHLRRLHRARRRGATHEAGGGVDARNRLSPHAAHLGDAARRVHDGVFIAVSAPGAQQISHLLVVNLDVRRGHVVPPSLLRVRLGRLDNFGHRARNDPARLLARLVPEHRVRLPRARLAVREQAHLVPVQRALHELRDFLEHLRLRGRRPEHAVEFEPGDGGLFVAPLGFGQRHRRAVGGDVDARRLARRRSDAAEHADVSSELLDLVVQCAAHRVRVERLGFELVNARLLLFELRLELRRLGGFQLRRGARLRRLDEARGERAGVARAHLRALRVAVLFVHLLAVVADASRGAQRSEFAEHVGALRRGFLRNLFALLRFLFAPRRRFFRLFHQAIDLAALVLELRDDALDSRLRGLRGLDELRVFALRLGHRLRGGGDFHLERL